MEFEIYSMSCKVEKMKKNIFSNFSCMFLNPKIFFQFEL